jgi:hypothetical protein
MSALERVMVCYVPALDLRRVSEKNTPFVRHLLAAHPWVGISTLPNVDHVPTLVTGTYPHEHGLWGLRLRADGERHSQLAPLIDALPDLVTTTAQCMAHAVTNEVDLATMPPSRRRRFEAKRFKFVKHVNHPSLMDPIGGLPSLFSILGRDRSLFLFHGGLRFEGLLLAVGDGRRTLELVEVHALDSLQHWNLDKSAEIAGHYRTIDAFVRALHDKCARNGVAFVLLSDHGMEQTTRHLDIVAGLRRLGLGRHELSYFIENTKATFWLHTDRARSTIGDLLASLRPGHVLTYQDLSRYGVRFPDSSYGDVYFVPEPGWSLFPNDFYHPVANLVLGLADRKQRARVGDPRHRGDHGYLPDAESERGWMLLADERYSVPAGDARLTDIAPSLLSLVGERVPPSMTGQALFTRSN